MKINSDIQFDKVRLLEDIEHLAKEENVDVCNLEFKYHDDGDLCVYDVNNNNYILDIFDVSEYIWLDLKIE